MTPQVRWTEHAVAQLSEIAAFASMTSAYRAGRIIERILDATERLAEFPLRGARVPEAPEAGIRQLTVGPYRILYLPQPTRIDILSVIHGRREVRPGVREVCLAA